MVVVGFLTVVADVVVVTGVVVVAGIVGTLGAKRLNFPAWQLTGALLTSSILPTSLIVCVALVHSIFRRAIWGALSQR